MSEKGMPTVVSSTRSHPFPPLGSAPQVNSQSAPPDATSPAVVAKLTGHRTEVPATLIDLAGRGLVRIEATPASQPHRKQFTLYRQPAAQTQLSPYEQGLLDAILQTRDSVALSAIAPRLAWAADQLDEALEAETTTAGWLDPHRQQLRRQQQSLAVYTALLGAAVVVAGLVLGGAALGGFLLGALRMVSGVLAVLLIGGGVALLALSLIALRRAATLSPLSEQGELAAVQWKAFAAYLKEVLEGRQPQPPREALEVYLPLAAALGLAEALGRHIQKQGGTLPDWFPLMVTTAEAGDLGAAAALLTLVEVGQ
jgi:hypothetical protein